MNANSFKPILVSATLGTVIIFSLGLAGCGESKGPTSTGSSIDTRTSPDTNWFQVSGDRERPRGDAHVFVQSMASMPFYDEDHPGLALQLRERDLPASKTTRVEIMPLPDPLVPGTFPLVVATTNEGAGVGANVVLPKDHEKVFLPMAIYGERVVGTLTLVSTDGGLLSGSFEFSAHLDDNSSGPRVESQGEFSAIRVPSGH